MPSTRRLAAILAADVAAYSRLMGADEEGAHEQLKAHFQELINPKIAEHRGRVVKNTGDGFLAEFASVVDAVKCAVEMQRGMDKRNAGTPPGKRIEFRVGINLGDVIVEEHDIFGDGVNVAARLEALADPGGVLVSNTVHEHVRDRLSFAFEDVGERQVKNITRPVRLYKVKDTAGSVASPRVLPAPLLLPNKPFLVVLPFQNMTGDAEQDYFVDGVVEEITTAISRLSWLSVIARNSAFTYKGRAVDVRQIAGELGVRYVLEGSVRKTANRVRITGQLVDTATGAHIWADRFDGPTGDIFELQDQIASSVVGAIEPQLRLAEIGHARRKPTESLDAYDLYLRALALRHEYTERSISEAVGLLQRALAFDPSYAPAAAMIGTCRIHQRASGLGQVSEGEVTEAIRLARGAIETGKADPDALWMAGWTLSNFAGEHTTARNVISRALALNPNLSYGWLASGFVSIAENQPQRAIEAFGCAIRLSPLDPWGGRVFTLGMALAHFAARQYEEASSWADRALAAQPDFRPAMCVKASSCVYLGRTEEAHDWVNRALRLRPGWSISRIKQALRPNMPHEEVLARYAHALRKAGVPEE
jgi:TolB-like protein/class 3 adenylate cyclase